MGHCDFPCRTNLNHTSIHLEPLTTTTMNRSIPEIAEELRQHVNNDNDAPRLIAEHVLPLLKIDLSPKELKDVQEDNDDLREMLTDAIDEVENAISDIDDENYSAAMYALRKLATKLRNR